jgi:hypothetical protein
MIPKAAYPLERKRLLKAILRLVKNIAGLFSKIKIAKKQEGVHLLQDEVSVFL